MSKLPKIYHEDINKSIKNNKQVTYIRNNTDTSYRNNNESDSKMENTNNLENTQTQETENIVSEEKNEGGLIEETLSVTEEAKETNTNEESSGISQMQVDADFIKANYSIVKPLEGEITSRFGLRNPSVETVPKYHTGIDIARVVGTVITAAMDGTVELVSSQGDYGNHVKITNGEVSTLYAHCSKIYVKQGDTIVQGQQIAEVGATGNVTGPHLHFEVRRNNQYVDPDLILQF